MAVKIRRKVKTPSGTPGKKSGSSTQSKNSKISRGEEHPPTGDQTSRKPRQATAAAAQGHAATSSKHAGPLRKHTDPSVLGARRRLGVGRKLFARMTGFSERAVSLWESGHPVSTAGVRKLKEMERLGVALAEVMRAEFIPVWLDTPNEGLAGLKPVEVLERGENDRLWRVVFLLGSGLPT